MTQFLRKISLVVGTPNGDGLDLSSLHCKFTVRRGDYQTPNTLDVRIYNPSDDTVKSLLKGNTPNNSRQTNVVPNSPEFSSISLSAGYHTSQYGLIFQGQIIQCRFGRENQADTYIDIRSADKDSFYNFAVMKGNLAAGSTPAQQFNKIVSDTGISVGYIPNLPSSALPRGKVFFGMARDHLRDLADTYQLSWSIQDGNLQLTPLTQFVPGELVILNSATGMINWPEQTANGIHIRCLLNPNIKIGRVVQVDNKSVLNYQFPVGFNQQVANLMVPRTDADGYYVVWVADHIGDTRGQEWYTDLTCLSINADLIPEALATKFSVAPPVTLNALQPYG